MKAAFHFDVGKNLFGNPDEGLSYLAMNKDVLLPNEQNPLIWINPGRMSGAPCFYKTRLPIDSLLDNLEDGVSLDKWLEAFPVISREQALSVLEFAKNSMLASA